MPLLWPVGHISAAVSFPVDDTPTPPQATPDLNIIGHLTSFMAASRSFGLAMLCIYTLHGGSDPVHGYPAYGRGVEFDLGWMLPIVMRNVVATWAVCGLWDYWLYFGPLKQKLHKYKLNQEYPSNSQLLHDALFSTVASVCGSLIEIVLCHLWATQALSFDHSIWDRPLLTFCLAITITHWRVPHFYCVHRMIHPWKSTWIPDVGKVLYRHIHALHHKSYNPTAFSGTNMHPVEALLYYSAALMCLPFAVHPSIALGCLIDCAVGAWLGHDGFQWPGSGDYFHQLHHAHFECNYGAMHVPIDKWVGTFAASSADVKRMWSKGV